MLNQDGLIAQNASMDSASETERLSLSLSRLCRRRFADPWRNLRARFSRTRVLLGHRVRVRPAVF